MSKKYICYYTDLCLLKWKDEPEGPEKYLIFDTKESAQRFADATNELPFMGVWDDYVCVTSVTSEVEDYVNYINATHLIPVMNGDDVELKEVD